MTLCPQFQGRFASFRLIGLFAAFVLAGAGLFTSATAQAQVDLDWQPETTWLFAVGILEWQHPDVWPGMPGAQAHRRDVELVEHFRASGVPEQQIVYLQDRQATRKRIDRALASHLANTRPGDLLVFYFTGHGARNRETHRATFANYDAPGGDEAWHVESIFSAIERGFRGQRALLIADCCYSGALADAARGRESPISYGCLCSSFSRNSSTGNWTFTESLLKAWRGDPAADLDDDGAVEWQEMGRFAELDMAFIERQKSVFYRTPQFDPRMKLAATDGPRPPRAGERLEVQWKSDWYRAQVIDSRGQELKIHYVGYADSWDEWVGPQRVRPYRPHSLAAGQRVDVQWDGDHKWYPATVVRSWYGLSLVHYDGYTREWDEWINRDALRPQQ